MSQIHARVEDVRLLDSLFIDQVTGFRVEANPPAHHETLRAPTAHGENHVVIEHSGDRQRGKAAIGSVRIGHTDHYGICVTQPSADAG